jgi:phosphoglycerate dehydrogenase-like enzyme
MFEVAILDDYQEAALQMADWRSLHPQAQISAVNTHIADLDALAARLHGCDAVVAMRERTQFSAALFARLPNLKLLVTTGMRNAAIDLEAASEHGEGKWQTTIGAGLKGKTLGLLGLGRLGAQVAAIGKAFGMEIIAWSQNLTAERAAAAGARLVDKEALFAAADIVSIHLVLGERTRALVEANDLARMKPSAFLVNTSRGPIVDERALIAALESRRIAGAAIDVFDDEPLPAEHSLRRLPNTVLTPHLGYVTVENYRLAYGQAVEAIRAYLAGAPIRVISAPVETR